MINLNEKLREMRKIKGYTQLQVSEKIGIERSSYSLYELGKRSPDYETLNKIADLFNCTTDYLLGRSEEPNLVNYDTGVDYEGDRVFIEIDKDYLGDGLSKEEIDEFIQMGLAWRKARLAREAKEKNKKPNID